MLSKIFDLSMSIFCQSVSHCWFGTLAAQTKSGATQFQQFQIIVNFNLPVNAGVCASLQLNIRLPADIKKTEPQGVCRL